MKWWDQMPWSSFSECWALSQLFQLSSFTFIKRLFSSSSLSAIRVVSSAYLRLLICLLAILIPACASSSPAFLMMYSASKLNKQSDSIQPWRTPFPVWNQSVVPCPVLTVASWPAYRFLKRQVRWSGIMWNTEGKSLSPVWLFATAWTYQAPLWDFPGNSTEMDCHFLLQQIFPTQGSNPGLPHCRQTLYGLSHQGNPYVECCCCC